MTIVIGVDGCKAGWIAARGRLDSASGAIVDVDLHVVARFADLLHGLPPEARVAVDMPIGLPDRILGSGRGPEQAVRPLLGARQSSVFAIPSRAAVEAEPGPFPDEAAMRAAHHRASAVARATSDPPKGISIQAFHLFPKVREIDALLRAAPGRRQQVFESHPEVAFQRLNGGRPLDQPKKVKGVAHPAGLRERIALLAAAGLPEALMTPPPPKGAGADDRLDALACLEVARRLALGLARPWPDPPLQDTAGLTIAIWA